MAQAVKKLFPNAKVTIGPAIENKFFYDFDVETPFTEKDLEMIEKKMFELASLNQVVKREKLSRDEAIEILNEKLDEHHNLEITMQQKGPKAYSTAGWRGLTDEEIAQTIKDMQAQGYDCFKMKISIITPTYNEVENIEKLYLEIKNQFVKISCDYEHIIIDNCSNDNTISIIKKIAEMNKIIKIILNK